MPAYDHFRAVLLMLALLLLGGTPASAQDTEATRDFMNKVIEVSNGINKETARDSAAKCKALAGEIGSIPSLNNTQRTYFEAEIESCLAYAMNNGGFDDEVGDDCKHYYLYTTKLAAAMDGWLKIEGTEGEFMANLVDRLDSAMHMGPSLGCKNDDYTAFQPTLDAARISAAKQPKAIDADFMGEIMNATSAITPESAKSDLAKCNAFTGRLSGKDLFPIEKIYFPALIEQCLSTAIEKGAPPDGKGDACAHLYLHAQGVADSLKASKADFNPYQAFGDLFREFLKSAIAHASELKCTQDFASIKEE